MARHRADTSAGRGSYTADRATRRVAAPAPRFGRRRSRRSPRALGPFWSACLEAGRGPERCHAPPAAHAVLPASTVHAAGRLTGKRRWRGAIVPPQSWAGGPKVHPLWQRLAGWRYVLRPLLQRGRAAAGRRDERRWRGAILPPQFRAGGPKSTLRATTCRVGVRALNAPDWPIQCSGAPGCCAVPRSLLAWSRNDAWRRPQRLRMTIPGRARWPARTIAALSSLDPEFWTSAPGGTSQIRTPDPRHSDTVLASPPRQSPVPRGVSALNYRSAVARTIAGLSPELSISCRGHYPSVVVARSFRCRLTAGCRTSHPSRFFCAR